MGSPKVSLPTLMTLTFRMGPTIVNYNLFSTYFVYFLLIETTFAAEEIIILSHTESTLTTDSAKVFG